MRRYKSKYVVQDAGYATPCWIWTGTTNSRGYAHILYGGAHRAFYEDRFGPVAEGLELDHLCRNRLCVNPDHLEAITHQENVRRGWWARGQAASNDLVRARAELQLTQEEMAQRLGIHVNSLANYERGRRSIPSNVAIQITALNHEQKAI